ncbi:hypothetical protein KY284_036025 [Solanum tuberosum]|nr:hypothetical protein KY284_036025 [Solanum tuberosum]
MEKKLDDVPTSQFKELLKYWNSGKFQLNPPLINCGSHSTCLNMKMSKTNSENRKKLKNPHTVGKKSFALIRNDLAEMENIEMQ